MKMNVPTLFENEYYKKIKSTFLLTIIVSWQSVLRFSIFLFIDEHFCPFVWQA